MVCGALMANLALPGGCPEEGVVETPAVAAPAAPGWGRVGEWC